MFATILNLFLNLFSFLKTITQYRVMISNEPDIVGAKIFVLTGHEHAVVNKTMFKTHEDSLITSTTNILEKQQHVQHVTADKVDTLKNEVANIFILGSEAANKALCFAAKLPLSQFFTLPSPELVITVFSGKLFNSPEHVEHVVNKHNNTVKLHESSNNNNLLKQQHEHVTETELGDLDQDLVILCEKLFMPSVTVKQPVVVYTTNNNHDLNNPNLTDKQQQPLQPVVTHAEIFELQKQLAEVLVRVQDFTHCHPFQPVLYSNYQKASYHLGLTGRKPMTPQQFVTKWRTITLKEKSAAQEHFIDLCRLVGHPTPAEDDPTGKRFSFEAGAEKQQGGRELVQKRDNWLNPPDAGEAELKKRTLTNLYNQRPTWLALAHEKLDRAVFAAYGWPYPLADEEILERLLALNLERAKGQGNVSKAADEGEEDE